MRHFASAECWATYERLPSRARAVADRTYALYLQDPKHPSLQFKRIGRYWSVRVGPDYRALGVAVETGVLWFWIGSQADYDRLIGSP